MVDHETLSLEVEKLINHKIKLVKQLHDQLSSNIANQDEVQEALDQRHHTERRLHVCATPSGICFMYTPLLPVTGSSRPC